MNCKSTVEMLSAYLDRELGHAERDAVRAHLAECDRCRADERELRALKGLLLGVRAPEPAPDFEQRLMSGLREEALRPARRTFSLPKLRPILVGQFCSLAAAAALATVVISQEPRKDEVRTTPTYQMTELPPSAKADFDVYAQRNEAYHLASNYEYGAPLLSP